MDSSDKYHTGWEEVHLPDACEVPKEGPYAVKGCMDKGASNYNPLARQPTKCLYSTYGCMDSNALNYNAEATEHDGMCEVNNVCGCTVSNGADYGAYAGVDPDTPKFQSLSVGRGWPGQASWASVDNQQQNALSVFGVNAGRVPYPKHTGIASGSTAQNAHGEYVGTSYDPLATQMTGFKCGFENASQACNFAIEGCMDSTAHNYNPYATINSATWCIPVVIGCMMPPAPSDKIVKGRFGWGGNYSATATVNAFCVAEVKGCMEPTAANYDPKATVNFGCYTEKVGCLHPHALNFNCTEPGVTNCTDAVTNHSMYACQFYEYKLADGVNDQNTADSATVTFVVSSDAPLTDAQELAFAAKLQSASETSAAPTVTSTKVSRRILSDQRQLSQSSYEVPAAWGALDAADYESFMIFQTMYTRSAAAAQVLFDGAGLDGFTVTSVSVVVTGGYVAPPPSAPPSADVGLIVGCVVAGLVGVLIIIGLIVFIRKKRKAKSSGVAPS